MSSHYKHLDARWEKEKEAGNPNTSKAVKANAVVFTYLPLLYNLCSSAKLDWQVCGSSNGMHGLLSNDYKVIVFGVYHNIIPFIIEWCHPLAYALLVGEFVLVALLLLHYLKCVALDLSGLRTPKFKRGIISDHTELLLVNAFQENFLKPMYCNAFLVSCTRSKLMGKGKAMGSI
jgi:hypothetical protein